MQSTNQPAKILIPFAQNDSAKVEIPATTTDATRFSQALGSPPLTGMPPEAGGVPPQLEDFNGAMNQQSRLAFWGMAGGRFPYDSAWANDSLIQGYPRGAVLPAAIGAGLIGMGEWYNNAEGNTADPDTVGAGWVPGYQYGATALSGQSGGTVTLTPAQAAKRVLTIAGTLTSNLVVVVPGWVYDWTVYNNTGGAFTVTVKNAATPAVEIPQNGAPTPVRCDGTAVSLLAANIAPAASSTQAMQLGQAVGRLVRTTIYYREGGQQLRAVDGGAGSTTGAGSFTPGTDTRQIRVRILGGGGGGGGAQGTAAGQQSVGGGGGAGGFSESIFAVTSSFTSQAITVGGGAGGGGPGGPGGTGGNTTFGSLMLTGGGGGGAGGPALAGNSIGAVGDGGGSTLGNVINAAGGAGGFGVVVGTGYVAGGHGGASFYGGAIGNAGSGLGRAGQAYGAGGSGASCLPSTTGKNGGDGVGGFVEVLEYA